MSEAFVVEYIAAPSGAPGEREQVEAAVLNAVGPNEAARRFLRWDANGRDPDSAPAPKTRVVRVTALGDFVIVGGMLTNLPIPDEATGA